MCITIVDGACSNKSNASGEACDNDTSDFSICQTFDAKTLRLRVRVLIALY